MASPLIVVLNKIIAILRPLIKIYCCCLSVFLRNTFHHKKTSWTRFQIYMLWHIINRLVNPFKIFVVDEETSVRKTFSYWLLNIAFSSQYFLDLSRFGVCFYQAGLSVTYDLGNQTRVVSRSCLQCVLIKWGSLVNGANFDSYNPLALAKILCTVRTIC